MFIRFPILYGMTTFKFDFKTETLYGKLIPKTDVVIFLFYSFSTQGLCINNVCMCVFVSIRAQCTWLLNDWLSEVNNRKLGNPTTPTRGPVSMPKKQIYRHIANNSNENYRFILFNFFYQTPLKGPIFLFWWFIVVKISPRVLDKYHGIRVKIKKKTISVKRD